MKKLFFVLTIFTSLTCQSLADPMELIPVEVEEKILSKMKDYLVIPKIKNSIKCETFYESDIYNKVDNRIVRCGDKSHDLYIEIESKPIKGEILKAKILWKERKQARNKKEMNILVNRYAAAFTEFLPVRDKIPFIDNFIYNQKSSKRYNNGFFITTDVRKKEDYTLRISQIVIRKDPPFWSK